MLDLLTTAMVIARREYRAATRTKAFLVSVALVPLILLLSLSLQRWVESADAKTTKKIVVVDRTGELRPALEASLARTTPAPPNYALTFVPPAPDAVEQRIELSAQRQRNEVAGVLEIGADVFRAGPPSESRELRLQAEPMLEGEVGRWATKVVGDAVRERRLREQGISVEALHAADAPVALSYRGLTVRDAVTGEVREAPVGNRVAVVLLPALVSVAMFMLVFLTALPAMQSVVEEKQQRIAEVLLASVRPFELMLGKLLGIVAVTLTLGAIYTTAGIAIAKRYGLSDLMPTGLFVWFTVLVVLAALMYGSIFLAVGAAAGDMKETQTLQLPVVMIASAPVMLASAIVRNPGGSLAVVGSFVPFSAPMMMASRLASPVAVPWWHPPLASVGVLALALACVWAAGRIFKTGLLMQGKSVRWADLARWVFRAE